MSVFNGRGVPGIVSESGGSGTVSGSHVYAENGAYRVTVTITDNRTGESYDVEISDGTIKAMEHLLFDVAGIRETAPAAQFGVLTVPSTSEMNSSTRSPRLWYFSRRWRLHVSAVCRWRFLVPSPITGL
jgi:hypothetical protein